MKYGPFDGRMFSSKKEFEDFISKKVLHYEHRVVRKTIGSIFESALLGEALFKHHPRFISESYSKSFGFIPLEQLGRQSNTHTHKLCVKVNGEWLPLSYRDILTTKHKWTDILRLKLKERWTTKRKEIFNSLTDRLIPICTSCCDSIATDVDHVSHQHKEIIQVCIDYAEQLEDFDPSDLVREYNKVRTRNYDVLLGKVYTKYDEITAQGTYQVLCKSCHSVITTRRRNDN